ncbi:MAG: phage holin family protein [Rhodospirillales bacterium]|nr:phage holin family protein [Rhodospirillales bacterium]
MAVQEKPIRALLGDLIEGVNRLVRQEIRLAQVESSEKLSEVLSGIAGIAAGLLVALVALLVLVQALVVALAEHTALTPALAALVVGVVLALIAFVLVYMGQKALRARNLALPRTVSALQDDKDMVMERTR